MLDLLLEYICGQDCILFCIFEVLIFYHIEMAYVKVYHSRNLFASLNLDPKTEGPEICAEQVSGPSGISAMENRCLGIRGAVCVRQKKGGPWFAEAVRKVAVNDRSLW